MPGELRTRYIKDDRLIRSRPDKTSYVRAKVFQPKWEEPPGRLELSTFGVDGLTEGDIWNLGYDHYLPEGRMLRGRADVPSRVFVGEELTYTPQPPPTSHGSFVNWSDVEEDRLEVMAELADKATVVSHPLGDNSPRKPIST